MITLVLYGKYKKLFGDKFTLHVNSLPAAIRLMEANFKGMFKEAINTDAFYIARGKKLGKHMNIEERHLPLEVPDGTHFHLIPKAVGGASGMMKKKGLGSILLGVVLIGASFLFPGALGMSGFFAGLSLVAGGASLLLTPEVGVKDDNEAKSYSFNGPSNSDEQGGSQQVIYGRVRAGSTVMAGSIKSVNSKKA